MSDLPKHRYRQGERPTPRHSPSIPKKERMEQAAADMREKYQRAGKPKSVRE